MPNILPHDHAAEVPMYRDPFLQFQQSADDPQLLGTPESERAALEQRRSEWVKHLVALFEADRLASFDVKFLEWMAEDSSLLFFLPCEARQRGLWLVNAGRMQ